VRATALAESKVPQAVYPPLRKLFQMPKPPNMKKIYLMAKLLMRWNNGVEYKKNNIE
jgi:hypothetical protein